MANPGTLHDWVEELPTRGRYTFSRAEALSATDASPAAVKQTLYRLKKRKAIVSPRRDFFVVLPPEYRTVGCPPAAWFIDQLMEHLGRRYYVALLTAGRFHGAAHQAPMVFQVIADAPVRNITVGGIRINFHASNLVEGAATVRRNTPTGTIAIATPETTAFDIVRFPAAAGYWNNVATVLIELVEEVDGDKLLESAARVARTDVQRLGWLLDFIGEHQLAEALAPALKGKRLLPTPLATYRTTDGAALDPRWKVLVNTDVDPDL